MSEPTFRAVDTNYGFIVVRLQDDDTFKQYSSSESLNDAKVMAAALNRYYLEVEDG